MGMDEGCKCIKHRKGKNSTPLGYIVNKYSIFKPIVFNPSKKPIDFNRFNGNENQKGSSPNPSYGFKTYDACD